MCRRSFCRVPPAPHVLKQLFRDYKGSGVSSRIGFGEYLQIRGYSDPSAGLNGMDDGLLMREGPWGPEFFSIPRFRVTGRLEVMVLLVDFTDLPGLRPPQELEELLFASTGASLRDYFAEVSLGQVEVTGTVHGWLRMPRPYRLYTGGHSGTDAEAYPNNAQGMAEDAVRVAIEAGVSFPRSLDKLGQATITALFIVHAGPGAEVLAPHVRGNFVWSHKWFMREPVQVGNQLYAATYLTVPEDCALGVCAHELGHLAFQWEDFYDANYDEDGEYWDGTGDWDLMASGSYNGGGHVPAYPAGVHRHQHGWIDVRELAGAEPGEHEVELGANQALILRSRAFRRGQYLFLENRQRVGFDRELPGEGLLVWRVDESKRNITSTAPGIQLVEADERQNLLDPGDYNQGDGSDPFPGESLVTRITDEPRACSTSFPNGPQSGITIDEIQRSADGKVKFRVIFA